jgi:hypothetical protein
MLGLYQQLSLMRVYQFITLPLVLLLGYVSIYERFEYGAPTRLSLACIAIGFVAILFNLIFECKTIKVIGAMEIIKELISPEDDWSDFLIWFNNEENFRLEVSRQIGSIRRSGQDERGRLTSQVQKAMVLLTGQRVQLGVETVERNTDPVPATG